MRSRAASIFLSALVAVLVASSALAGTASASPTWHFNGVELSGSETITGDAILSSLTIPGLTTQCKTMHYAMTISNAAGIGQGEVTELSFKTCVTNSKACAVKSIGAEKLPWAARLATVGLSNYVVVEGVKIGILYTGAECALDGTLVTVKGSVGGLYDNPTETFTFNAGNSKATKSELKALGTSLEWNGAFTTEATGPHSGQALTVS